MHSAHSELALVTVAFTYRLMSLWREDKPSEGFARIACPNSLDSRACSHTLSNSESDSQAQTAANEFPQSYHMNKETRRYKLELLGYACTVGSCKIPSHPWVEELNHGYREVKAVLNTSEDKRMKPSTEGLYMVTQSLFITASYTIVLRTPP